MWFSWPIIQCKKMKNEMNANTFQIRWLKFALAAHLWNAFRWLRHLWPSWPIGGLSAVTRFDWWFFTTLAFMYGPSFLPVYSTATLLCIFKVPCYHLTETLLYLLSSLIKLLGARTTVHTNMKVLIKGADVLVFYYWQITNSLKYEYAFLKWYTP